MTTTTPGRAYDYAWARPSFAALASLGTVAIFRYLGDDTTGKNLTHGEAVAAAAAGIRCVSNFEFNPGGFLLGHSQGIHDATLGEQQHADAGGPADKPILFSGDKDIRDYAPDLPNDDDPVHARAKLGPAAGYWDAIAGELGLARSGAYGGYWLIRRLFTAGLITYGWQTYAWSGGQWDPRAQARQVSNGVSDIPGVDMDRDELWGDIGAWFPVGTSPTPAPVPAPHQGLPVITPGARTLSLTTPRMVGTDVAYLQRFIGPLECGVADGIYGPHTAAGVTWYERMRGMRSVESPGVAGPEVWRNILHG